MLINSSNDKIIVGYDLANICSQISYSRINEKANVSTVAYVAGEENFDIPTVLLKKCGMNQWLYGKEALRFYEDCPTEGILVDDLWMQALSGETVRIEGEAYEPEALLTLFVKRSLGLLSGVSSLDKMQAILFTCDRLTSRAAEVLQIVSQGLGLRNAEISLQDYQESYYGYMLYQPQGLWEHNSLLMDYRGEKLKIMKMESNANTSPVVVHITESERGFDGEDEELLEIAQDVMGKEMFSSVYLIGEKFSGDWMTESLKYLCDGRRVFQGNNLYSKGACFCLQEKMQHTATGKNHVFLGMDKLKANVGMNVLKQGESAYYALLDAGIDWHEIDYECEVYLQDEDVLELMITPLVQSVVKEVQISLEGLGLKQGDITRIYMHFTLKEENILRIEIEDLGFGCFRETSGKNWRKEILLY